MKLGTYIKNQRKKLSLTQSELAKKLNIGDYQLISNIERNRALVPLSRVKDFARVLEIPEDTILLHIVRDKLKHILKQTDTDNYKLKLLIDITNKLADINDSDLFLIKELLSRIGSK